MRDGAVTGGLGLMAGGLAGVSGYGGWEAILAGGGACGGVAVAVLGERNRRRQLLHDRLVEALAPVLAVRALDRRTVQARQWRGWPGLPERLVVAHSPAVRVTPAWKEELLAVVMGTLVARYRVESHDPKRGRFTLVLEEDLSRGEVDKPYAQVRAERAVAALMGPTAIVTNVTFEGENLTAIEVKHKAGEKLAASGYRARVEKTISIMHSGRWRAIWDLEGDTARFEVRPHLPDSVWMSTDMPTAEESENLLANYGQVRIPYAVDEDGNEIYWEPAKVPQMLITGGTGTGKTSTTHAIVGEVTKHGWPVWVLDGKRVEFLAHRTWPNVQIVASTMPQQVALVHAVYELMRERFRLMEEEGLEPEDFEPLVVVLDEWSDFVQELLAWYGEIKVKGDPPKPPTLREEATIARQSRLARIHLIKTMQRADVALLGGQGGEVRSNFGQRISVGRIDPQGAMMMWDSPAVGVSIPRGLRQRAITTNADGTPVEVQCYRFPAMNAPEDSEAGRLREQVRPAETRHPRLLIKPPEALLDLDDSSEVPASFWDYAQAEWVLAAEHPELDPVVQGRRKVASGEARVAASAMAVLGLAGSHHARPTAAVTSQPDAEEPASAVGEPASASGGHALSSTARLLRVVRDDEPITAIGQESYDEDGESEELEWKEGEDDFDPEDFTGYSPAENCRAAELVVGDLIQLDDGQWVVLDEPPEDDPTDDGTVMLSWRSDSDDAGVLSIPTTEPLTIRRPEMVS